MTEKQIDERKEREADLEKLLGNKTTVEKFKAALWQDKELHKFYDKASEAFRRKDPKAEDIRQKFGDRLTANISDLLKQNKINLHIADESDVGVKLSMDFEEKKFAVMNAAAAAAKIGMAMSSGNNLFQAIPFLMEPNKLKR